MDVVALGLAKADATKKYASLSKQRAGALLSRFGELREAFPAVTIDAPTVTHGTTDTVTGAQVSPQSDQVIRVGDPGSWSNASSRLTVKYVHGLDFILVGDTVEITWFNGQAGTPYWIFIDGAPMTAAPVLNAGLTGSADIRTKMVFASSKRRRIEFYLAGNNGWKNLATPISAVIQPSPARPKVALIGDSFFAGSDTTFTPQLQTAAVVIGRMLGANFSIRGVSGTGYYTSTNSYGSTARIAEVAAIKPDLIIISGSVNDDSHTEAGANAAATYAALAAACPGVPIIVFGPQPSNASDTVGQPRASRIADIKAAALAAPNVIAFLDMIGNASGTAAPAWVNGTQYPEGSVVSYKGSIYQWANNGITGGATPGASPRWKLLTWLYTGTGTIGSVVGDGTRDTVLYSDGVHPTATGSYLMGVRQASEIIRVLTAYATV